MSRRVTVSPASSGVGVSPGIGLIPESSCQQRPSSRAPRSEGTANFGHFRGADDPTWHQIEVKRIIKAPPNIHLHEPTNPDSRNNRVGHSIERRMGDLESMADSMLNMAESLHKDMITSQDVDEVNESFNGLARPKLVNNAKREMRKNKRILAENKDLRHSLAEHQTVLEMVMNKFREVSSQCARLESEQSCNATKNGTSDLRKENQKLAERVGDMLHIMSKAASQNPKETENWMLMKTHLKQLRDENLGLRSLLSLSQKNGSHKLDFHTPIEPPVCEAPDSESLGSSSGSDDTVLTNSSDDEPIFEGIIDSMVKEALQKAPEPDMLVLVPPENDSMSISSEAETIVENGDSHDEDEDHEDHPEVKTEKDCPSET